MEISAEARSLIQAFLTGREERLGRRGIEEIKRHPFFRCPDWTFENIRECVPPVVLEQCEDDDTRNFEEIERDDKKEEVYPTPNTFAGNHLPFVGFTYTGDYQLLSNDVIDTSVKAITHNHQHRPSNSHEILRLERMLERERSIIDSMEQQERVLRSQLETVTQREREVTAQITDYDMQLTMLKHNYRDAQRKIENELELRKRVEAMLTETKKRLDDEQNKRTKEMSNNQQQNDKINMLEKQLTDLHEKVKNESDGNQKLKRQLAELRMLQNDAEDKSVELQSIIAGLQAQRDVLQQEVANLQTRLAQERSARTQSIELEKELEVKIMSLSAELERYVQREQQSIEDNHVLNGRISDLEKENATITLELKNTQNRYNQEVIAHKETEKSRLVNKEEANMQEVKGEFFFLIFSWKGFNSIGTNFCLSISPRRTAMQTKLNEEKVARQKADQMSQEKERQISMLSVDYRQIQQRLQKLEGENRQVSASHATISEEIHLLRPPFTNQHSVALAGK